METFHFDLVLKSWRGFSQCACVTQYLFKKCLTKYLTNLII